MKDYRVLEDMFTRAGVKFQTTSHVNAMGGFKAICTRGIGSSPDEEVLFTFDHDGKLVEMGIT